MSEDEDEDDLKYAMSDGEDEEAGYIPSGKTLELLQTEKACYSGYLLKKGEKRRVSDVSLTKLCRLIVTDLISL